MSRVPKGLVELIVYVLANYDKYLSLPYSRQKKNCCWENPKRHRSSRDWDEPGEEIK